MTAHGRLVVVILLAIATWLAGMVAIVRDPFVGGLALLSGLAATAMAVAALRRSIRPRRRQARADASAGVVGRTSIGEVMVQRMALASRQLRPLTVAVLEVNDPWGLESSVPIEISRLRGRVLRQSDLVGRLGRHRFLVLLDDADDRGATAALQRAIVELRRDRQALEIRAAVATYPRHGLDSLTLLDQVDAALDWGRATDQTVSVAADPV